MSLLKNLKTDSSIAGEKDSLGGGFTREAGLYDFEIVMAYLLPAESEALGVFVTFKDKEGKEFKYNQYVTSGKDKGCKNTYVDKDDKVQYLPGFLMMNSLAELSTGFPLNELDTEEKAVKVYDKAAKAEVPKKVQVITEMLGKKIIAGVIKEIVQKQAKGDDGKYHDVDGTREQNDIDKFFCANEKFLNMTSAEIRAKHDDDTIEASFYQAWEKKNKGQVRDRTGGKKAGSAAGAPVKAGAAAGAGGKPTSSLFG